MSGFCVKSQKDIYTQSEVNKRAATKCCDIVQGKILKTSTRHLKLDCKLIWYQIYIAPIIQIKLKIRTQTKDFDTIWCDQLIKIVFFSAITLSAGFY